MTFDKYRRCNQIDGKQGAFSSHASDLQNPVDLGKTGDRYFNVVSDTGLTVLSE